MKEKLQSVLIVAFIIMVFISSISYVFAEGNNQQSSSGYYQLNLVIEEKSSGGSNSSNMYSFYVLNHGVLEPSNILKVPFGKEVKITIVNFDQGISPPLTAEAGNVSGVVGGTMLASSSISVSQAQSPGPESWQSVSYLPASEISHTFSTSTGLNLPIFPHSTEVAYTYFNAVGNYSWACMCQCGITSMSSAGSMMGELVVLPP